jgi:hypothetical protein
VTALCRGRYASNRLAPQRASSSPSTPLANQAKTPRAQTQPHRDFLAPPCRTHQHQIGYIRTSDQQHQAGHDHQHEQRFRNRAAQVIADKPGCRRIQSDSSLEIIAPLRGREAGRLLRRDFVDGLLKDHVHFGARLFKLRIRFQPGHHAQPLRATPETIVVWHYLRRHL